MERQTEMLTSFLIFIGSVGSILLLLYLIIMFIKVLRDTFGNVVLYFLGGMILVIVLIAVLFNFFLSLF
jgi:hypothetical protein